MKLQIFLSTINGTAFIFGYKKALSKERAGKVLLFIFYLLRRCDLANRLFSIEAAAKDWL